MTSRYGGFIASTIVVVPFDPSPAALESLDEGPVSIDQFIETTEYLRAIEENERQ